MYMGECVGVDWWFLFFLGKWDGAPLVESSSVALDPGRPTSGRRWRVVRNNLEPVVYLLRAMLCIGSRVRGYNRHSEVFGVVLSVQAPLSPPGAGLLQALTCPRR